MSIEQEIRDLRIAIGELITVMKIQTGAKTPIVFNDNLEPQPLKQSSEPPSILTEERELDYVKDIQKPALKLIQTKGRDALAGILAKFGAKTAKEIDAKRWPELLTQIEEALR